MRKVLFVDDEIQVLDGLRDRLRRHRKDLDMRFAVGGHAALAEMERDEAHVVVTDMRMPDMDGATLLERVRDRWPAAVRSASPSSSIHGLPRSAAAGNCSTRSAAAFTSSISPSSATANNASSLANHNCSNSSKASPAESRGM